METNVIKCFFVKPLFLSLFVLFTSMASGEEILKITNKEGKIVEGVLRAKDETSATIEIKNRNFKLPFEKLSAESVALIKKSTPQVVVSKRFKLDVDVKKRGETNRSASTRPIRSLNGEFDTEISTSTTRVHKIDGAITVSNRHNSLSTAPSELEFVMLVRNGGKVSPMNFLSSPIEAVEPLKEKKVDIPFVSIQGKTKVTGATGYRTPPKTISQNFGTLTGTYYGYICAIYQDGKIVECKSIPASFERDLESVASILSSAKSRSVSEKLHKEKLQKTLKQ